MNDITVKTAAMNNNNKPVICKFIKLNNTFEWRRRKIESIWNTVFIFPRVFTLKGIVPLSSANLCLIAITKNSLQIIIIAGIKNKRDS